LIARHISLSAAIWSAARLRRNQPASLELRNRLNSLTPRKWAKIPWDFTYLCWANPYILFPARFLLVLKSHPHATPRNRYLFETRRFGPFTTRRFQKIVQGYREMAGIMPPLHPHLFRHQMLTFLTSKGLSDA
jgi:integrase